MFCHRSSKENSVVATNYRLRKFATKLQIYTIIIEFSLKEKKNYRRYKIHIRLFHASLASLEEIKIQNAYQLANVSI